MFNRAGFNRLHFNRATVSVINLSASLHADSGTTTDYKRVISVGIAANAEAGIALLISRVVPQSALLSVGSSSQANTLRVIGYHSDPHAEANMIAEVMRIISLESIQHGEGRIRAESAVLWNGQALLLAESYQQANPLRLIAYGSDMSAEADMNAALMRIIRYQVHLSASSELQAIMGKYKVQRFSFTGSFAPGDEILIIPQYRRITRNGENVRHMIDGNWIMIMPGENQIQYSDTEMQRTIRQRITHRDRLI